MIYNQKRQSYEYRGQKFKIGDVVYANTISKYYGLIGTIEEIRTGIDAMSNGEKIEIVCDFYEPVLQFDKDRISKFLQAKKGCYHNVVVAPLEVRILHNKVIQNIEMNKIYLLIEYWNYRGEGEKQRIKCYADREDALMQMRIKLDAEAAKGIIKKYEREDFVVEETDTSYQIYIRDEFVYDHYSISVEQADLIQ